MQTPSLALRTSLYSALQGIVYKTKTIPVYEEKVNPSALASVPTVAIGTDQVKCYIVLLNQTENDDSPKCHKNDACSIQIQINTVFPLTKGGSKTAEEIENLVYSKLFPVTSLMTGLVLPSPFTLWKSVKQGSRSIQYDSETNSIWTRQITFQLWISQSETYVPPTINRAFDYSLDTTFTS